MSSESVFGMIWNHDDDDDCVTSKYTANVGRDEKNDRVSSLETIYETERPENLCVLDQRRH